MLGVTDSTQGVHMNSGDPVNAAKEGLSLVTEIMKAAGDSPSVKEAAGNLGQTAVTLTRTINNVLLPLAAINFAFDKARNYFSGQFQQDLAEKTASIPTEHIVEPKASIAGPTLQGLAFTHEEPNLKKMYLNLLATALDGRKAGFAHPAFVEIIRQLDCEEAKLIAEILRSDGPTPIVQTFHTLTDKQTYGKVYNLLIRHSLNLIDTATGKPVEDLRLPAMVDNWIRLGLVEVVYDRQISDPTKYAWAAQRPEVIRMRQTLHSDAQPVDFFRGVMQITDLGRQFASAVGIQ